MRSVFPAVVLAAAFVLSSCSSPDRPGMVRIGAADFMMGTERGFPYEGPPHRVTLDPYWIDTTEVTNADFEKFVGATGYVTTAEEIGTSVVFKPEQHGWDLVEGADWRHPEGPETSIAGRMDNPVVDVSWDDAVAYCEWAGKRLPTEAEFEYAERGGLPNAEFAWGNEFAPGGQFRANTWQGIFPEKDEKSDGFSGVAPVKSFSPNGYGLYDMTGNVWEWVADWFDPSYYSMSPTHNPLGPKQGTQKVQRGGSWLCSSNYCQGYRVASRMNTDRDSGLTNLGFRCAADD
ncbi:MAG: formylglycine-generating enzyme family protein [Bryobacterales bacterium]